MGWLFQNEKLRHETPAQLVTHRFSHESDQAKATVLAAAAVRGAVYAAIRNEEKITGKSYVFCAVVLFRNSERNGFGYTAMDESMGPYAVDCPDRIMRLLSPVDEMPFPGSAAAWRAGVAAAKAQRRNARRGAATLLPGDVIRLQSPVTFRASGITASAFRYLDRYKRTPIFEPVDHPGVRCRLRAETIASATVER